MMPTSDDAIWLALECGGSHASAALLDGSGALLPGSKQRVQVAADRSYTGTTGAWVRLLRSVRAHAGGRPITGMAVATPGPFDYQTGLCLIEGLAKFDAIFGANIRAAFAQALPGVPAWFVNDAQAFALGVDNGSPSLALTLGTGFGAAFVRDGRVCVRAQDGVPAGGELYGEPWEGGIIEDAISTRGLLRRWGELGGDPTVPNVAAIIDRGDPVRLETLFAEFGETLGRFLVPYLTRFGAKRLVVGGGIARASAHFGPALAQQLARDLPVAVETETETAALRGAVAHARAEAARPPAPIRLSGQQVMPARKPATPDGYDIFPSFAVPDGQIAIGHEAIIDFLARHPRVALDGFAGVVWEPLVAALAAGLGERGIAAEFRDVRAAWRDEAQVDAAIAPYLGGEDPLFGRLSPLGVADLFDIGRLARLRPGASPVARITYGPGAALADAGAVLAYVDCPKNELQYRARAGSVTNLGARAPLDSKAAYKRSYFVDWPMLNRHKQALLPRIALFIDDQRVGEPASMTGENWRAGLAAMARAPFRARPWFEPGAWGGQWMKQHIAGLPPSEPNLAWSFELIAPENGVVLRSGEAMLECSFDCLMFAHAPEVLGDAAARFGTDFPIRFDFLDTFDGGNLSLQVHPSAAHIRREFGEPFTQDETYYILDCAPGATVYAGFAEGIDAHAFEAELTQSARSGSPVDVGRNVRVLPAAKHDLFLIPNGTIHCAGVGNLVLEISATPYIYTFKLYDWLRPGLDGKPRPLNVARGIENLRFDRQGSAVQETLVSRPVTIEERDGYKREHLPTHADHFYDIHRHTFESMARVAGNGQCRVLNVVGGESIEVRTAGGAAVFRYAETFVIPAVAGDFTMRVLGQSAAMVVDAFVRPA